MLWTKVLLSGVNIVVMKDAESQMAAALNKA